MNTHSTGPTVRTPGFGTEETTARGIPASGAPRSVIRPKRVGLPCGRAVQPPYTLNLFTGGCPHNCLYCYARGFREYRTGGPKPVAPEAIGPITQGRLFLSSASDPFHPLVAHVADQVLRAAFRSQTFVVISTKALVPGGTGALLGEHRERVSFTVSLSSTNPERNATLEPGAPSAEERIEGREQDGLWGIKQLAANGVHVTLKTDTLFPDLDDNDERIRDLFTRTRAAGAEALTISYAFYRKQWLKRLSAVPFLTKSLPLMSERQPIASGVGFSLPLAEKARRLGHLAALGHEAGFFPLSTCACKNRLAQFPTGLLPECHFHDRWFRDSATGTTSG